MIADAGADAGAALQHPCSKSTACEWVSGQPRTTLARLRAEQRVGGGTTRYVREGHVQIATVRAGLVEDVDAFLRRAVDVGQLVAVLVVGVPCLNIPAATRNHSHHNPVSWVSVLTSAARQIKTNNNPVVGCDQHAQFKPDGVHRASERDCMAVRHVPVAVLEHGVPPTRQTKRPNTQAPKTAVSSALRARMPS